MTRVLIVGCGAIGSVFAAHLARVEGIDLWGYDISGAHVAAMNSDGLTVTGKADFTARFKATTDAGAIPPCDLGIVATKSEYTNDAVAAVAHAFGDGAVASLQNGLGNEEIIAQHVPRVIRGTTLLAGAITAPGIVRFDAPGDTWLGPFEPKPASSDEVTLLADLLERGGLRSHPSNDARGAQWTKLVFNAATNAVGALTGLTIGEVGSNEQLRPLVTGLIDEGYAVARSLGIQLSADPQAMIDDAIIHAFNHRASMLQDVAARRHTEVSVLNGGIVAAGREAGVPTPLNEAMASLIRGLESSWR